jgi:hypothetical protein
MFGPHLPILGYTFILKMEAAHSSETSVTIHRTIQHSIPEDDNFQMEVGRDSLMVLHSRFFFPLALQPQLGPWPTSMKLSVSLQFSKS